MVNNIIKNRYYVIIEDNEPYAYISVKKDFYTEGVLFKDKSVLSGYFPFYDTFKAFVLDNRMKKYIQRWKVAYGMDNVFKLDMQKMSILQM